MLAVFKVKMSGSEMKKANRNTSNKIFCKYNDIFSIEHVTWKFHIATTTAKKCTRKCAVMCKVVFFVFVFFCLFDHLIFWPFSLPPPLSIPRFYF